MLARDLVDKKSDLLKTFVILIAPNFNPDGNDTLADSSIKRRGQNGPPKAGTRENGQPHGPQSRFRQSGNAGSEGAHPRHEYMGSAHHHRLPHDQRQLPPLHAHLRHAAVRGCRSETRRVRPAEAVTRRDDEGQSGDRVRHVPVRQFRRRPDSMGAEWLFRHAAVRHSVHRRPRPHRHPLRIVLLRHLRGPGEGDLRFREGDLRISLPRISTRSRRLSAAAIGPGGRFRRIAVETRGRRRSRSRFSATSPRGEKTAKSSTARRRTSPSRS